MRGISNLNMARSQSFLGKVNDWLHRPARELHLHADGKEASIVRGLAAVNECPLTPEKSSRLPWLGHDLETAGGGLT
jgi:hypothetical protein